MSVDPVLRREAVFKARTGKVPFPYQRVDIRWLTKRRRAKLFHDPGLGKTIIWLLAVPDGSPVLVCCPGVGKGKWADEVRATRPDLTPVIIEGRRDFRWPFPGEVVIVNWESLPHSHREYRRAQHRLLKARSVKKRVKIRHALRLAARSRVRLTVPHPSTTMIGDEVHRAKNPEAACTMRWQELTGLALHYGGRSWDGTGTPLVNRLAELYAILQSCGLGQRLFGTLAEFLALAEANPREFEARLKRCSVRRTRADVLPHLPPKTREILPVELSEAVRARCDQLTHALRRAGNPVEALTLEALRSLVSPRSPWRKAVSTVRAALAEAKIPAVLELLGDLHAQGVSGIVVASAHRRAVDEIGSLPGWTRITGSESHEEKTRRAAGFQAGDFDGCSGTYRAFGESIDLFRAWRGISVDLPWTVAAIDQFESRLQRIGQKAKGLLFTRVVANHPLELRVEAILREKQEEIERRVETTARKVRNGQVAIPRSG